MSDPSQDPVLAMTTLRQRTLAELEHQRRADRLSPAEFERRAASARGASTPLDLRPLISDLVEESSLEVTVPSDHTPLLDENERSYAVAILSSSNLSGHWEPAEQVYGFSLMGNVKLDFREAALLEGVVTTVSLFSVLGGCQVIVPPDIHVSVSGTGLLGSFGHIDQRGTDARAAHLHINGLAVLGGVDIKIAEVDT